MLPRLSRPLARGLLSATLLAAPLVVQAKDAPEPVVLNGDFRPAEMATKVFATSDGAALKGIGRVAVPLFTVEFVTADSVSASTSGFGTAGRSTASLYYKLQGVGEPEFQALTDTLYAEFLQSLKAGGMEVIAPAQFMAESGYRKLMAGASPAPLRGDSVITLAPPGMAVYGFSKATAGGHNAGLFGALANVGSGFAAVGAAMDSVELAKELNATLLEVQMRVNFVQLTNHNKGFLGRMALSASASGTLNPSISSAQMRVLNGTQTSTLTMQNPLALDSAAFAEVREKPATGADVAGAVALGLLKLAIGSKDSSSSQEMEAVADPVRYPQVIGAGLSSVREMLVLQLRAGQKAP